MCTMLYACIEGEMGLEAGKAGGYFATETRRDGSTCVPHFRTLQMCVHLDLVAIANQRLIRDLFGEIQYP